jgi:uncharacterized protein (TIGR03435 family)
LCEQWQAGIKPEADQMMSKRSGGVNARTVALANVAIAALTVRILTVGLIPAQAPSAIQAGKTTPPQFEVATVKPTQPAQRGFHELNCKSGTGFAAREQTLLTIIEWAYDLPHGINRVSGGPNWMSSPDSAFDIHGKVERKVDFSECLLMVQSLLAERFALATHWETREVPVYVLSVGKKGSKLHEASEDPKVMSSVKLNGDQVQLSNGFSRMASGRGMSMGELARFLSLTPTIGRPVIDKTGLEGFYGFSLDYATTLGDDRPDIFTAVQEQLGLKLEAAKGPVEFLVIDHAERPSEN